VFKCQDCKQGILIDNEIKALRVTTQALLGTQISGSILAFWPDGKIAADKLPFTINVARVKTGRLMF
jgi:hypothetical protein